MLSNDLSEFQREAMTLSRLHHPHVLRMLGVCASDGGAGAGAGRDSQPDSGLGGIALQVRASLTHCNRVRYPDRLPTLGRAR
jgi:hypothetical protein